LNSGFCFDFRCSINLWIGPWYASLDMDSVAREAQSLNLFSVLSQILGWRPVKTTNRFGFEFGCQIYELLTNHFSLMLALWVSSSDGTEGQRKSFFSMENVESHHPMSKSLVASADGTEYQTISTDLMEMDLTSLNPVCYLRRAQRPGIFPHTRVNQWKSAYLLSRADLRPHGSPSSTLCLPPYSSLPLTSPEFRCSIIFYRVINMSNLGDIGYLWRS
jgi:hypothetical protein